jgi:hypothetical protein
MNPGSLQTAEACMKRAIEFRSDAEALVAIPNQWYAVCYFYAAYHCVRAALLEDPVFKDLTRLKSFDANLIPDDRFNGHHAGRLSGSGPRKPGVSDMVKLFYPDIAIQYERLHGASVAVRYGFGLSAYQPNVLAADFAHIAQASTAGKLVA